MTKLSELGFVAEGLAAKFLEQRSYKILGHNFRRPWGEIDVIAEKDDIIVFVEVKAGTTNVAGFEPELRADWEKMRKVVRTARTYLSYKKIPPDKAWQIDIISVVFEKGRGVAQIKHFKNVEV